MSRYLIIICIALCGGQTLAQLPFNIDSVDILRREVIGSDTFYVANIPEVNVIAPPSFDNKRDFRRYKRLVRNVKKAYPYAKIAGDKLREVNQVVMHMETEKERKQYIKQVEKELLEQYEDELKGLTITQGKILIKLIDRETGETSYELVEELRGKFSAIFWQALARIFGSNLKSEFDAEGEDYLINQIVLMIESGQISLN